MSTLLKLTPAEFCAATNACSDGRDWALTQPTMADVWDNCPRADWLLWIADKLEHRPDDRTLRLFAVWCARNTPLADGRKTGDLLTDPRSVKALGVAERHANGLATDKELAAARAAAAGDAAWAAAAAAGDAAWYAAGDAAWAAARDARAAAGDAAWAAAWAARAAAWDAAWAAWDAADAAQAAHFRTLIANPFKEEIK